MTSRALPRTADATGDELERANRRAGRLAFAWVLLFVAWHVVWLATGLAVPTSSHFSGGALAVYRVATTVIDLMFVAGFFLPLALVQRWGRRFPRWLLLSAAWIAAGLLAARGLAGLVDDLLRALGFDRGLTGMTMQQTEDTAHVTTWVWVSAVITDVLFTAGGPIFALAARAYARLGRQGTGVP